MKKILSLLARLSFAGVCLSYSLWGVDFNRLGEVLVSFRPWAVAVCGLSSLVLLVPSGLRLSYLAGGSISALAGWKAVTLGLALNNILPARLGEMGKALYLRQKGGLSLGHALEAVFWERLFDLNALLLLGVALAALLGERLILYPLLAVVGTAWSVIVLAHLKPEATHVLLRFIPTQQAKLVASEMLLLLGSRLRFNFLFQLSLWTLLAWTGFLCFFTVALCFMAGLPTDPTLVLSVFAVATLGLALPAAPGGMGVYEAAIVLALGWFGVDKERAFAVGLALHMLQYLPITVAGMLVLAGSGMNLGSIRKGGIGIDHGVEGA